MVPRVGCHEVLSSSFPMKKNNQRLDQSSDTAERMDVLQITAIVNI